MSGHHSVIRACSLAAALLGAPLGSMPAQAENLIFNGNSTPNSYFKDDGGSNNIRGKVVALPTPAITGSSSSISGNSITVNSPYTVNGHITAILNTTTNPILSDNKIIINGGTVTGNAFGVYGDTGAVRDNQVLINNGGTVQGNAYGGYTGKSAITGNKVTISNGTVGGNVYGGYNQAWSSSNWDVSGNAVSIDGGKVGGNVYGSYTEKGTATGSSVTIGGNTTIGGNVYGGYSENKTGGAAKDVFSGNILTKNSDASLNTVGNFEYVNFGYTGDAGIAKLDTTPTGSSANTVKLDTQGNNIDFGGAITGSGNIEKNGAGELYLHGANSYTGGTTVNGGVLAGTTDSLHGNITNNATLEFRQDVAGAYAGIISGLGQVNKSGDGTVSLNGANTYAGGTYISGGLINFNSTNNLGTGSITLDGGGLQWATGTNTDISGKLNPLGAGGGTFDTNGNSVNLSNLSGAGGLNKIGSGTLTLNGANTYSGETIVDAGTLAGNIASGTDLTVANGATYDGLGAAREVNSLNGGGSILNNYGFTAQSGIFDGVISGAGDLNKIGSGTLILNGANMYTGGTTVSGGLLIGNTASLQGNILNNAAVEFQQLHDGLYAGEISGTGSLNKTGGGTLSLSGTNTYTGGTTVTDGLLIGNTNSLQGNILNNAAVEFQQLHDGLYAGEISGTGSLNKTGGGALSLSGTNTYTGGTTVADGLLIGDTRSLQGNIANNGRVEFQQANDGLYAGAISGTGSLHKAGDGVLTLSGLNNYSGLTEVLAGGLALSGSGSISDHLALHNGTSFNAGGANFSLSRLDVWDSATYTGKLNVAGGNLHFYVPAGMMNSGKAVLLVNGAADISSASVAMGIDGASSPLKPGDSIQLINATGGLSGNTANSTVSAHGTQGVSMEYDFALSTLNNVLLATITKESLSEETKALSEGSLSGLALVGAGADFVAGQGMDQAVKAARRTKFGETGTGSSLAIFGASSSSRVRYNTGSHVDVGSVSTLAGVAFGADLTPGRLTLGALFEYGNGDYSTYNSLSNGASVHGSGKTFLVGGGLLGRMDFPLYRERKDDQEMPPDKLYVEASFRAGSLQNQYHSNDLRDSQGRRAAFSSTVPYYGLHVGTGYIWNITDRSSLDLSAKYFWSRMEGDSVDLSTGEKTIFKKVDSQRLRLGARFTYSVNDAISPYIGVAWEREFNGKAEATINGRSITPPKMQGVTGIGELGLTLKPSLNLPLSFDIGVQGYTGKREGVTGSLQVKFEF